MFCCWQGHTEGKTETVFVLLSSTTVYFLQRPVGKKKFQQLAAIPFTDIDFVSVSMVCQTQSHRLTIIFVVLAYLAEID